MQLIKNIDTIPYIRILAFNDKGREILKEIKNKSEIKIINKFSNISFSLDDTIFKTLISYDIKATNIYNSIYYKNNKDLVKGPMDFYTHPIYVKQFFKITIFIKIILLTLYYIRYNSLTLFMYTCFQDDNINLNIMLLSKFK